MILVPCAPDLELHGSSLKEELLCSHGLGALRCAGVSVSAHDAHDGQCVGCVCNALTGEMLPIEVLENDTVQSLRQRAGCALHVEAWQVSLMNGIHVLDDDAALPWVRPLAGPLCCTLTFLVQVVDLEGIAMAMEAACKEWCATAEGEAIEHVFICMTTPFPILKDR